MPRWKLMIEYDGRPYVGWQRQDNGPSVQATLEAAMAPFAGPEVALTAAGRTDAGVHALGMVAHVDVDRDYDGDKVCDATNGLLRPHPIAVLKAEAVGADFHARFSCTGRRYRYRIANRRAPPALDQGRAWHINRPLDVVAMNAAAQHLLGHHDFTSFRSTQCQSRSPNKTLDSCVVLETECEEIRVEVSARSFLHHQVRNMVGTLSLVGLGRWQPDDVLAALQARDRRAAGPTAPADGLYFVAADYADHG